MAPAPAPAPTMMTMEEESIVVEGEGEVQRSAVDAFARTRNGQFSGEELG